LALLELEQYLKPVVHQQAERSNGNLEPYESGIKVAEFADLDYAFYQRREAVGVMDISPRKIMIHRSNY